MFPRARILFTPAISVGAFAGGETAIRGGAALNNIEGTMMIAPRTDRPPEYEAALKEQQGIDLERSFDYASKTLGIGIRRRA